MPFVLDASIAAAWVLQDEDEPAAQAALKRIAGDEALVPALFWFEIRNILVVSERRGRITEALTRQFLRSLVLLPISVDSGPEEERVLRLARLHKLSVYDAAYLELAQRKSIRLASLDEALLRAAKAEKTKVVH
jgi:predicted nucleic acid-binding protein